MNPKCIVVIPTYNERENLEPLIRNIWSHVDWMHVLVVDDNSPDGTGMLADQLHEQYPDKLFVLHRPGKQGLGKAYQDAFRRLIHGDYELILQMDADGSHDPAALPEMIKAAENSDLVIGSRYLNGVRVINWDFKRLVLSTMATRYTNMLTGMGLSDTTGGYKCWRRTTLRALDLDNLFSSGYLFQIETTYKVHRMKLRISEVPIIFYERRRGQSKIDLRIIFEATFGVIRLALHRTTKVNSATVSAADAGQWESRT